MIHSTLVEFGLSTWRSKKKSLEAEGTKIPFCSAVPSSISDFHLVFHPDQTAQSSHKSRSIPVSFSGEVFLEFWQGSSKRNLDKAGITRRENSTSPGLLSPHLNKNQPKVR